MRTLEHGMRQLLEAAQSAAVERELQWWRSDPSGRWVVLEPGPGRLLKEAPRDVREYVDVVTEQRGRRFSSLSRARAFARHVGGEVRRWRRRMNRRYMGRNVEVPWQRETNPWARATRAALGPFTFIACGRGQDGY